jgi:hypothetical protein
MPEVQEFCGVAIVVEALFEETHSSYRVFYIERRGNMFGKGWNIRRMRLWRSFVIALGVIIVVVLSGFGPMFIHNYRMRHAICQNGLRMISTVGDAVTNYDRKHGQMPVAARWSEIILENTPSLMKTDFRIPQFDGIDSAVAYNSNLSDIEVKNIAGNIVLLFEADGQINLAGGADLMIRRRAKDAYFESLFSEEKFVYIYFVDKTIAKYRLRDGAISKYDTEKKWFSLYTKDSIYSPLRWQPDKLRK